MAEKFTDIELLRKIPILSELSDEELQQIIDSPDNTIEDYAPKEMIVRESEIGDCMYVILEGAVDVSIRGEGGGVIGREVSIATLRAGDFFGDQSILSDTTGRRKASVRAFLQTKVFKIDEKHVQLRLRGDFASEDTTVPAPGSGNEEIRNLIKGMRLFQSLKDEEIATVESWTEVVSVGPGDFVLKESEKGDCLYVILDGMVEIFTIDDDGKVTMLATHGKGDYFGEQALMPGSSAKRNAYARSNGEVKLVKVPKAYFRLILNRDGILSKALEKVGEAQKKELDQIQKSS